MDKNMQGYSVGSRNLFCLRLHRRYFLKEMKMVFFLLIVSVAVPSLSAPLDDFRECRSQPEESRSQCFAQAIEKAQVRYSERRRDSQLRRDRFASPDVSGGMRSKAREIGASLNLIAGMVAPPGNRGYYDLICLVILLEYATQEKFWEIVDTDSHFMSRQEFDTALQPLHNMCKKSLDPVVCNHGIEEFYKVIGDEQTVAKFATAIGRSSEQVMGIYTRLVAEAVQAFMIGIRESNSRMTSD